MLCLTCAYRGMVHFCTDHLGYWAVSKDEGTFLQGSIYTVLCLILQATDSILMKPGEIIPHCIIRWVYYLVTYMYFSLWLYMFPHVFCMKHCFGKLYKIIWLLHTGIIIQACAHTHTHRHIGRSGWETIPEPRRWATLLWSVVSGTLSIL